MTHHNPISQFCVQMLEALEIFDASIPPYGLYAAGDLVVPEEPKKKSARRSFPDIQQRHPEWFSALSSFIRNSGGSILSEYRYRYHPNELAEFEFEMPDLGKLELRIAKISKIKVRQYGSSYHVDKHENFGERWEELRMDRAFSHLWAKSAYGQENVRLLLFIGFDKAQRPFEREFSQLKPHNKRDEHGVIFESREWTDKVGRGFSVRAALWAHAIEN